MSEFFVTSDMHFGHANVIGFCNRPYPDVHSMNVALVNNWNQRVKEHDTVYHLGDFCLSGKTYVSTPQGSKLLSSIKKGDKVLSAKISNSRRHNKKIIEESVVSDVMISYSDYRLEIDLENGKTISSNETHPFAVLLNKRIYWTNAINLRVGDILFCKKDVPLFINIINRDTLYKLGYIIGYSHGDGNINKYNIDMQSIDFDGIKRIVEYIKDLFNIDIDIKIVKNKYYRIKIPKEVCVSLSEYDFTNKDFLFSEKLEKNRSITWYHGWIAGYFDAEGNCQYQNHNWYIRLGNTNKELNYFSFKLLQNLGFKLTEISTVDKGIYKTFYCFRIITEDTFNFFITMRPAIKRKYPNLTILANGIKIKNIRKVYPKYTRKFKNYNIAVEPNNNFFANEILVHNCFRGGKEGGLTKAETWEAKLNGKIIHIKGNHDKANNVKGIITHALCEFADRVFLMTHQPPTMKPEVPDFCDFVLCGHVHEKWKYQYNPEGDIDVPIINVGIDQWNYRPVKLFEIIVFYEKLMRGK